MYGLKGESQRSPADLAMDRYAGGDAGAFAEVYDSVAPALFAYLRRRCPTPDLAEDLVQQTLLTMHRARGTFISGSPVLPWAFAIGRRLLIDEVRKSRRNVLRGASDLSDVEPRSTDACPEDDVAARELALELEQVLSSLPPSQRKAFELLRLDGLSHNEAARALTTTVSAIKLRAHRAYVALRTRYTDSQ